MRLAGARLAAAFFAGLFLAAAFFVADFFVADFFTPAFFTAALRVAFLATTLRPVFFAAAFFAGFFFAADFFAAFFAGALAICNVPSNRLHLRAFQSGSQEREGRYIRFACTQEMTMKIKLIECQQHRIIARSSRSRSASREVKARSAPTSSSLRPSR